MNSATVANAWGPDRKSADDSVRLTTTPVDEVPPEIEASVSSSVLRPPEHQLVQILASVEVTDVLDPSPAIRLVSITNNEPDEGLGDGDTSGDVRDAASGADDRTFALRAERTGLGSGRVYTVVYEAADASGNTATAQATASVPQKAKK